MEILSSTNKVLQKDIQEEDKMKSIMIRNKHTEESEHLGFMHYNISSLLAIAMLDIDHGLTLSQTTEFWT